MFLDNIEKNQFSLRYEGQLISMAEPIPIQNVPLVRPHDAHHFLAADGQAETDSSNFELRGH